MFCAHFFGGQRGSTFAMDLMVVGSQANRSHRAVHWKRWMRYFSFLIRPWRTSRKWDEMICSRQGIAP